MLCMSNKELQSNQICRKLSNISGSDWIAIKFEKAIPAKNIELVRFCEAVYKARKKPISLALSNICCDGARRSFGWLKDNDAKLAQRLSEKTGTGQNIACELIRSVPVLNEKFAGISIGKNIDGDVYISYANPESAMKLVRSRQKVTGQNLDAEISGVMSVCGNVAVKSYIDRKISISFGCSDSRKYGGIAKEQLVIGLPHKVALRICAIKN
jgi:uncharacterized protein (DUF169 family)